MTKSDFETYYIKPITVSLTLKTKFFAILDKEILPMADIGSLDNAASGLEVVLTIENKSGNYEVIVARILSRIGNQLRFSVNEPVYAMDVRHIKGWFAADAAIDWTISLGHDGKHILHALAASARMIAKTNNIELKDNLAIILTPEKDSFSIKLKEE